MKNPFKRKKKEVQETPKEWLSEKDKKKVQQTPDGKSILVIREKQKIRIPGFRTAKRVVAFFLMIANFLFAIGGLGSPEFALVISLFFWVNGFLLLDYVWKTRGKAELEWEKQK